MKLLIIDNADTADKQFNDALIQVVSRLTECDVLNYKEIPQHEEIVAAYSGIILSGVPVHYSFESIQDRASYFGWLQHTHLPVLGICLAHEAMGLLFGASIIESKEAETGVKTMKVVQSDRILRGISPTFDAYVLHRASITMPESFELLVRSDVCGNEVMKHKERPMYGFQFHPELSTDAETFFKNFIAVAAALYSPTNTIREIPGAAETALQ
jgi:GMP synthase (glutamine-hydrolysing)